MLNRGEERCGLHAPRCHAIIRKIIKSCKSSHNIEISATGSSPQVQATPRTAFKSLFLGLSACCVLAFPASASEFEAMAEKKSILDPAVNAKKYSKKYPIGVGLSLVPESAFNGNHVLECTSSFHRDSDRVEMKAKLTRTVTFVDEDGQETEVELSTKKAKGTSIRFEFPLPQVDLSELGPNLEAYVFARLKLLKRKKITRVVLACGIEYE